MPPTGKACTQYPPDAVLTYLSWHVGSALDAGLPADEIRRAPRSESRRWPPEGRTTCLRPEQMRQNEQRSRHDDQTALASAATVSGNRMSLTAGEIREKSSRQLRQHLSGHWRVIIDITAP